MATLLVHQKSTTDALDRLSSLVPFAVMKEYENEGYVEQWMETGAIRASSAG